MKSLLIRSEDKNIWERRSPLVPGDIKTIIEQHGARVFVQESDKRYFPEDRYLSAGAEICSSMEPGDIIAGVKEIPVEKILPGKVYIFFSHTIKGQEENMPMLKKLINSGCTLIDYEKICDSRGVRQVYFGPYAGDAGAINILWAMGRYWGQSGLSTPFSDCKQALEYGSVNKALEAMKKIGDRISAHGLPGELCPLVIGIMGYGNVSRGVQNILRALPVKEISPEDLPRVAEAREENKTIFYTVFREEHLVEPNSDKVFNLKEYFSFPERFHAVFKRYLPHLSILVNATYWEEKYPRFVTWQELSELYSKGAFPKLQGIADITCDVGGSIECNVKTSDSGNPVYTVFPQNREWQDGIHPGGIVVLAVDNLPAELPEDASRFFSNQFSAFVPEILQADFNHELGDSGLPEEIKRAVIVYRGKLTPDFEYLKEYL